MPLQNRVNPSGEIFRSAARGTIMGNRGGVLHKDREIVRPYKSERWITCVLEFKNRRRVVMTENLYTELFFLDEATSFAAGHRPCAECRRDRFNAFRDAWRRWKGNPNRPMAPDMDSVLHPARLNKLEKVTYQAALETLPNGCFVQIEQSAYLVWDDALLLWTPDGYTERITRLKESIVTVLTPHPTVACLGEGYTPDVHLSAVNL